MPREGGVTIVNNHDDDPALLVELARTSGLPHEVVLVRPVPGVRGLAQLAVDLLIGMGKRYDALAREKQRGRAWVMVELWLRAEQTRHLVVADAERLSPSLWAALGELATTTPAHLWMVTSTAAATNDQARAAGEADKIGAAGFPDLLLVPGVAPARTEDVEGPLPSDDFLTFRASCRDLLAPGRFEAVDAVYRLAYEETVGMASWLSTTMERPSKAAVLEHLRRLTGDCAGPAETLVRCRAAQAAFFAGGLLVNLTPSVPGWGDIPALALTADVARRLRGLVSPELCAALAIKAAHRHVDPSKLRVGAVTPGGSSIVSGGATLPFPEYGRALVEVQRVVRLREGAQPEAPLFLNPAGAPAKTDVIRRYIRRAGELAGVGDPIDTLRPLWHGPWPRGYTLDVADLSPARKGIDDVREHASTR